MTATYAEFLDRKTHLPDGGGFEPTWLPGCLFGFQRHLVTWAVRRGRAAIFAECGLGKTLMQLVWAENVVRHTNRPVLVLAPLGVLGQTVREGEAFGIDCVRSSDGSFPAGARVVVANYERLHHFTPADFAGAVCDESGCLKHFKSQRAGEIVAFMRTLPYRLLCSATPAPNDYHELGTSSESLGELGFQDMVSKFFSKETTKDNLGWGRTKYKMRGHAERDFWRWVCSWARAVRKPSDLGFDDGGYSLPELVTREHVIESAVRQPGRLFDVAAVTLEEQREERRRTLPERCEKAAGLIAAHDRPAVAWCHLNPEGDRLARLIPGAVQVSGADDDEAKEEAFAAFAAGQIRVLVTKPTIAGFGLNWQHCAHQTFFPSHSFEQYYQAVRRCWRFGQNRPVAVDLVTSEGEAGVLASLRHKEHQAEAMFDRLVELMNDTLRVRRPPPYSAKLEAPKWLSRTK
jgi:hypothetical protein